MENMWEKTIPKMIPKKLNLLQFIITESLQSKRELYFIALQYDHAYDVSQVSEVAYHNQPNITNYSKPKYCSLRPTT